MIHESHIMSHTIEQQARPNWSDIFVSYSLVLGKPRTEWLNFQARSVLKKFGPIFRAKFFSRNCPENSDFFESGPKRFESFWKYLVLVQSGTVKSGPFFESILFQFCFSKMYLIPIRVSPDFFIPTAWNWPVSVRGSLVQSFGTP